MLLVFGSINLDFSFTAPRLPAPGETVMGHGLLVSPGGKGANQAHAAQRHGTPTVMVGAVGEDDLATLALSQLRASGVDLQHLRRVPGSTGSAAIVVDDAGENQIVVAPGANALLRQADVSNELLAQADAVLVQMEVDVQQTLQLLSRAQGRHCMTVLNNAPAQALDAAALACVDLLVVNEGELVRTAQGAGVAASNAPEQQLEALAQRFGLRAVLTLGARGVVACDGRDGDALIRLPALPTTVADTTGAGDTFVGVLAAALVDGAPFRDGLARASVAAGLACARAGAQVAQPLRHEIEVALTGYRSHTATRDGGLPR